MAPAQDFALALAIRVEDEEEEEKEAYRRTCPQGVR